MSRAEGAAPVKEVLAFLGRAYPDARVLLDFRTPFELLVATVLAAQCTDERVNRVTPGLFRAYAGPASFANDSSASRGEFALRPSRSRSVAASPRSGPAASESARVASSSRSVRAA